MSLPNALSINEYPAGTPINGTVPAIAPPGSSWSDSNGDWTYQSGGGIVSDTADEDNSLLIDAKVANLSATVICPMFGEGYDATDMVLRYTDANDNLEVVVFASEIDLYANVNGNATTLATITPSNTLAALTITVNGSTATISSGGQTASAEIPSSLLSGTIVGFYPSSSDFVISSLDILPIATPSTTILAASNISPSSGANIVLTATVSNSSATGNVTFSDGSTPIGIGTLLSGVATYTVSAIAAGSHSYAATYNGDPTDGTSTSSTIAVTATTSSVTTGSFDPTSGFRRAITISHSLVPNTDQTDFPILVSGSYPYMATVSNGGKVASPNGFDIVFTADAAGQQLLDYEIDTYDSSSGTANFWVRIPSLSHTVDTIIYMFYGVQGVTGSQENRLGVWRNNYVSVFHLGNGSFVGTADSASAGYTLSGSAAASPGVIGGGVALTGDPNVSLAAENVVAYPTAQSPVTLEAWSKKTAGGSGEIFAYGANSSDGSRVGLGSDGNNLLLEFENFGIEAPYPADGAWHHFVGVYGGGSLSTTSGQIYIDGAITSSTSLNSGTPSITSTEVKIGGIPTVNFCCAWTGGIDEARISSVVRSSDWIATEYSNQSSPSAFLTLGAETTGAGAPTPTVNSFRPTQVTPLGSFRILGENFGPSGSSNSVTLNGVALNIDSWTDTEIVVNPTVAMNNGRLVVNANGTSSDSANLVVRQPVISWAVPAQIPYGTGLTSTQLNASASIPGSFTYTPTAGTILPAGSYTLGATFTPEDGSRYIPVSASVPITVGPVAPVALPSAGFITTIAGDTVTGYSGDGGQALQAELDYPYGIAVDAQQNVYIADSVNNVVRKVSHATGVITTYAGTGAAGYTGDGGLATAATLDSPFGLTLTSSGDLLVADTGNNCVRLISAASGAISTVAGDGSGIAGYSGDGGTAIQARLNNPSGLSTTAAGDIYIADRNNNAIRYVNHASGIISTFAGSGSGSPGYSGDGGAAISATLNAPFAVALDQHGILYLADSGNSAIRAVTTDGNINTIAGGAGVGFSGDGGPANQAQLNLPLGIALDSLGVVYIADWQNEVIRRVDPNTKNITTVAGNTSAGYFGDQGTATSAALNGPTSLAVDPSQAIYIADTNNMVVRVLGVNTLDPTVPVKTSYISIGGTVQQATNNGNVVYDSGTTSLSIYLNGIQSPPSTVVATWGSSDTPATLAASLATAISASIPLISAKAIGSSVYLLSSNGGQTLAVPLKITNTNNPMFSAPSLAGLVSDGESASGASATPMICNSAPALTGGRIATWSLPTLATPHDESNDLGSNDQSPNGIACVLAPSGSEPSGNACTDPQPWIQDTTAAIDLTAGNPLFNAWFGVAWSNFSQPIIPSGATVTGIYAAVTGAAEGMGAYQIITRGANTFTPGVYSNTGPQSGTCYSDNLLTGYGLSPADVPTQTLTALVWQTEPGGLNQAFTSNFAGFETVYTLPKAISPVPTAPNRPEVTIVAWVNGQAQDIVTAVNAGPNTPELSEYLNGGGITCSTQLLAWSRNIAWHLETAQDRSYANAWLIQHSANKRPSTTSIDPDAEYHLVDAWRLFNDFGAGKHRYAGGKTPFPCKSNPQEPSWLDKDSEASPFMGASKTTTAGNTFQLAEARIGPEGQTINALINNGLTTPYIWSVVEFDPNGNPVLNSQSTAIFPTYELYINRNWVKQITPQSAVQSFASLGETYQLDPKDIQ